MVFELFFNCVTVQPKNRKQFTELDDRKQYTTKKLNICEVTAWQIPK